MGNGHNSTIRTKNAFPHSETRDSRNSEDEGSCHGARAAKKMPHFTEYGVLCCGCVPCGPSAPRPPPSAPRVDVLQRRTSKRSLN